MAKEKDAKADQKPGEAEGKASEEEARRIAEGAAEGRSQEEARLRAEEELRSKVRYVEVIVDNLGPKLFKKGQITSDPEIVALLDTERGKRLVREVTPEG